MKKFSIILVTIVFILLVTFGIMLPSTVLNIQENKDYSVSWDYTKDLDLELNQSEFIEQFGDIGFLDANGIESMNESLFEKLNHYIDLEIFPYVDTSDYQIDSINLSNALETDGINVFFYNSSDEAISFVLMSDIEYPISLMMDMHNNDPLPIYDYLNNFVSYYQFEGTIEKKNDNKYIFTSVDGLEITAELEVYNNFQVFRITAY